MACTTQQVKRVNDFSTSIKEACAVAIPLANSTIAIPVIGPYVSAGVLIGCTTNTGLAKLTSDPNSLVWLTQQIQILRTAN